jgi:hypothetical protein
MARTRASAAAKVVVIVAVGSVAFPAASARTLAAIDPTPRRRGESLLAVPVVTTDVTL